MYFFVNIFENAPETGQNAVKGPSEPGKKRQDARAERVEIKRAAEENRRIEKETEAAAPGVERKKEERRQQHDAEERVGGPGELRMTAAQGAQEIVEKSQRDAERGGPQKLGRLEGDRELHQPKIRAKRPPAGPSSS